MANKVTSILVTNHTEMEQCRCFPIPWTRDGDMFRFRGPDISYNCVKHPEFYKDIACPEEITSLITQGEITDYSFLKRFSNLEQLYCYDAKNLHDIGFIETFDKLQYLAVDGANITDVTPIANLIGKQEKINQEKISNGSSPFLCSELKCLSITNSNVKDVSPFSGMKIGMNDFNFSFNQIEGIEPLCGVAPCNLFLQGNKIKDIRPYIENYIRERYMMMTINFWDNPIETKLTNEEIQALRKSRKVYLPEQCYTKEEANI